MGRPQPPAARPSQGQPTSAPRPVNGRGMGRTITAPAGAALAPAHGRRAGGAERAAGRQPRPGVWSWTAAGPTKQEQPALRASVAHVAVRGHAGGASPEEEGAARRIPPCLTAPLPVMERGATPVDPRPPVPFFGGEGAGECRGAPEGGAAGRARRDERLGIAERRSRSGCALRMDERQGRAPAHRLGHSIRAAAMSSALIPPSSGLYSRWGYCCSITRFGRLE